MSRTVCGECLAPESCWGDNCSDPNCPMPTTVEEDVPTSMREQEIDELKDLLRDIHAKWGRQLQERELVRVERWVHKSRVGELDRVVARLQKPKP